MKQNISILGYFLFHFTHFPSLFFSSSVLCNSKSNVRGDKVNMAVEFRMSSGSCRLRSHLLSLGLGNCCNAHHSTSQSSLGLLEPREFVLLWCTSNLTASWWETCLGSKCMYQSCSTLELRKSGFEIYCIHRASPMPCMEDLGLSLVCSSLGRVCCLWRETRLKHPSWEVKVNGGWATGSVPSMSSILLHPRKQWAKNCEIIPAGFGKLYFGRK